MQPGARLGDGRYVIRGVLGEGAQGTTYDAVDEREGRPVAIKRFDVRGAKSWKDVELAEREARVLATIDHPLVPKYYEHFEESESLYLVMDESKARRSRRSAPAAGLSPRKRSAASSPAPTARSATCTGAPRRSFIVT